MEDGDGAEVAVSLLEAAIDAAEKACATLSEMLGPEAAGHALPMLRGLVLNGPSEQRNALRAELQKPLRDVLNCTFRANMLASKKKLPAVYQPRGTPQQGAYLLWLISMGTGPMRAPRPEAFNAAYEAWQEQQAGGTPASGNATASGASRTSAAVSGPKARPEKGQSVTCDDRAKRTKAGPAEGGAKPPLFQEEPPALAAAARHELQRNPQDGQTQLLEQPKGLAQDSHEPDPSMQRAVEHAALHAEQRLAELQRQNEELRSSKASLYADMLAERAVKESAQREAAQYLALQQQAVLALVQWQIHCGQCEARIAALTAHVGSLQAQLHAAGGRDMFPPGYLQQPLQPPPEAVGAMAAEMQQAQAGLVGS